MNPHIFREYDIRGIVNKDLTDDVVTNIGRAYGTLMRRQRKSRITIGGDCRLSTEQLRRRLMDGIRSTGCDVINLGLCTTPVLYFSLVTMRVDGGIMITGSHNPPDFNGFKICVGSHTMHGAEIQQIRSMIEVGDFKNGHGNEGSYNIIADYQEYLSDQFTFAKKIKVGIDAGNGTAGEVILPILATLGIEVTALNCEMNGSFPVHHPDPTVPTNLTQIIRAIKERKLDVGIAFDGDGDRIGALNEKGEIVWGDKLMVLYARDILSHIPGATIIGDVKCSSYLFDDIKRHGGNPIMWKTGHSLIKAKMKEVKAALGGEMSGHTFFADRYFGFDDAIYAALRLIEIIAAADVSFSELLHDIPRTCVTPEIRIPCSDEKKFRLVEAIKQELKQTHTIIDIDGVRVVFDDGWGLVRASNTQAVLVMRFEADSEKRLNEMRSFVEAKVKEIAERI